MISKPLFKQSCKATAVMWTAITAATCFMLAVVIVVIGTSSADSIRASMVTVFQDDAVYTEVDKNAVTYYDMTATALETYEEQKSSFDALISAVTEQGYAVICSAYDTAIAGGMDDSGARDAVTAQLSSMNLTREYTDALINYYLVSGNDLSEQAKSSYIMNSVADAVYEQLLEEYDEDTANSARDMMETAISQYLSQDTVSAGDFAADFIAQMLGEQMPDALSEQGFIYTADEIQSEAKDAISDYRGRLLMDPDLDKQELIEELSESLLDKFPQDIRDALVELQDLDVFGLIVGTVFFKSAGLILPIVYIIMTANSLIAGQVDSGSMAYVLSTPTKRNKVIFTQALFLMSSLLAMFICTTVTGVVCLAFMNGHESVTISYSEMILLNLGAFATMFAISGICFLASAAFNRSKQSMSLGGGLSMFFLVSAILGLFGSKVMPSAIRIDAMNVFNYVSIISFFDSNTILAGTTDFIWKLVVLAAVGIVLYIASVFCFKNKDLPL